MTCSILVGGAWGDEGKGKEMKVKESASPTFVIMISQALLLVQESDQMQGILLNSMAKNMA